MKKETWVRWAPEEEMEQEESWELRETQEIRVSNFHSDSIAVSRE